MKIFRQFNSVFYKLIISYIILVIGITLIIGSAFYFYFTSRFNQEVEKVHQKMLEQASSTLNAKIIEVAVSTYMELVTTMNNTDSLFQFDDKLSGNHAKISQTNAYLQKIISKTSSIISDIHIFYKKQDILISSSLGIKYLDEEQRQHYKDLDWMQKMNGYNGSNLWLEPREIPSNLDLAKNSANVNMFTYVRTYPIISSSSNCDGLIAIDIDESALSNIIKKTVPIEYSNTFIINNDGKIISHVQKDKLYEVLNNENYISKILNSTKTYGSSIANVNGIMSMVSFTTLQYTNWKLINITPISQFYKGTSIIKQALLIVCLFSIVLGILAASVISSRIYDPLRIMLKKVRVLVGSQDTSEANKENEYNVINFAIDDLSLKVNNLQATLQANKPIIKHNLIRGLLHHQILNDTEVTEKLRLISISMDFPNYAALTLEISPKDAAQLSIENSHFIKYNIIHEIENYSDNDFKCIAVDLPEYRIGIIIGSKSTEQKWVSSMVSNIASYTYHNFMIMSSAVLGTWVNSLLDIHKSFEQTKILYKYKYFYPRISLLCDGSLLDRENSTKEIPDTLVNELYEGLNLRNIKKVEKCLNNFKSLTQEGTYAADHCHQKMVELLHTLSLYMKEMHYELIDNEKNSLYHMFSNISNIQEFESWMLDYVQEIFDYLDKQNNSHNSEIIEMIKKYIFDHLSDDLSLDRVAEYANISSAYLSKIFKDESGINFVTYIKELRLEKAKELILSTDSSIQQIGSDVGYNTTAYFIQQFKAKYGYTPNDYRKKRDK